MKTPLQFGIIGCGMIADFHAQAIGSLKDDARLAGVSDYNLARAEEFAGKYGIRAYESTEALLNDAEIDAVCICTPSSFHAEGAIEALSHGKHVVLEKPMALRTEAADQVVAACAAHGKLLTVIAQLRFSADVRQVKKLMEEGAFGKVAMCSLYMKYWRTPEYYSSSPWKGTYRFDGGGALMNQGIHGVDMLQYLAGEPRVVSALTKTVSHNIEVEDTATALLEFESGAMGVIEASTCAYPGFARRLEIVGDRGHAVLREDTIEQLTVDGKAVELDGNDRISAAGDPTALEYEMHARQIANLIAAVRGEEPLQIDAAEGRKAVRIIEDIYRLAGRKEG